MSFMTSLGNLAEGFVQGEQVKDQRAYQQALLKQQQEQSDEQKKLDAATLRNQGVDPATGQPLPFNVPKSLSQIIPGNGGNAQPTADDYVKHYLGLAAEAVRQNRPDLAQEYSTIAQQWGLGAERSATAQYTLEGRLPLAQAQAAAERDLPQRAREIAGENNSARLEIEAQRLKNSQLLAQYNEQSRYAIAQLAGAYHIQGIQDQDAIRQAVAEYQAQTRQYMQGTSPQAQILNPQGAAALGAQGMPAFPSITINTGQPGGLPPLPVPPWQSGGAQPPSVQPKNQTEPKGFYQPQQVLKLADEALKAGTPPAQIKTRLDEMVKKGEVDAATARQVETMLHIPLSPLPVAGGSQATSPFGLP